MQVLIIPSPYGSYTWSPLRGVLLEETMSWVKGVSQISQDLRFTFYLK